MRSRRWPAGTGRQVQDRPFAFRRRAGAPGTAEEDEDEQGGASGALRTSPAEATAHRGRKTGVLIRVRVSRDSSGMENLAEFWQQDGFESLERDSSAAGDTARRAHFPGAPSRVMARAKSCVIPSPVEEDALAETRGGSDEMPRSGGGGSSSSSQRIRHSRELRSTSQGSSLRSSTASVDSRQRRSAASPASKASMSALCTPSERQSAGSSDMDSRRSLRQDGGGVGDQEVCRMLHVHLSVRGGNRPREERICRLTCMSTTLLFKTAPVNGHPKLNLRKRHTQERFSTLRFSCQVSKRMPVQATTGSYRIKYRH